MLKIRVEIGPHNHTWNLTFEISSYTTYVDTVFRLTIEIKI